MGMELIVHGAGSSLDMCFIPGEIDPSLVEGAKAIQAIYEKGKKVNGIPVAKRSIDLDAVENALIKLYVCSSREWREAAELVTGASLGEQEIEIISPGWNEELVLGVSPPFKMYKMQNSGCEPLPEVVVFPVQKEGAVFIKPVECSPLHPYTVMLQRGKNPKGFVRGAAGVVVVGITITRDEQVLLGVRKGPYQRGKVSPIPAGSASWPCTLWESLKRELKEEVGVDFSHDLSHVPKLAAFIRYSDGRFISVFVLQLSITAAEAEKRWQRAEDKNEHSLVFGLPVKLCSAVGIGEFCIIDRKYKLTDLARAVISAGVACHLRDKTVLGDGTGVLSWNQIEGH